MLAAQGTAAHATAADANVLRGPPKEVSTTKVLGGLEARPLGEEGQDTETAIFQGGTSGTNSLMDKCLRFLLDGIGKITVLVVLVGSIFLLCFLSKKLLVRAETDETAAESQSRALRTASEEDLNTGTRPSRPYSRVSPRSPGSSRTRQNG
ncbi:unnamed protein product [Symbiodinium microadriaticum]|nr:unnamed protein product [Symbiodinium microadriaticum]